jgi:hypothetical protein
MGQYVFEIGRWFAQFCSCARPVKSELAEASGTSLLQEALQKIVPPADFKGKFCKFTDAVRRGRSGFQRKRSRSTVSRAVAGRAQGTTTAPVSRLEAGTNFFRKREQFHANRRVETSPSLSTMTFHNKRMVPPIFATLNSMSLLACVNLFGVVLKDHPLCHDEIRA